MQTLEKANQYIKEQPEDHSRPLFHVTAPTGWINDPNGFSLYQGEYHLFYQHYPYKDVWGPMHWGHAKTKDFITWEDLPVALAPDQPFDEEGCFSGSGLETPEGHVLVYTGLRKVNGEIEQNQCVAIGDGLHYQKLSENPVALGKQLPKGFSTEHFRDPKVWEKDGTYYLVAGNKNADNHGQIVLFTSTNLRDWQYKSVLACDEKGEIGVMWECPDFFPLDDTYVLLTSPQDMVATEEFHNGNNALWMRGRFDEENGVFTKEVIGEVDDGIDFYAPQTLETADHRRIMIGWMQSWDNFMKPADQKWANMMSLPRELSMKDGHLIQKPVREINQYHQNVMVYAHQQCLGEMQLPYVKGRCLDMTVTIHSSNYHEFTIQFAKDKSHHVSFTYHKDKNMFELDRSYCGMIRDVVAIRRKALKVPYPELTMRVILDRYSAEIFINGGEQVFSTTFYTPLDAEDISFTSYDQVEFSVVKYDLVK